MKSMTAEDFIREEKYLASMHIFRNLLAKDILTPEEYRRAEQLMAKKYKPKMGALFSEMALT